MEITNTKNIDNLFVKILVHGPAGAGKTRLCRTTGGKPLIISVEGGLLSLRGEDLDVMAVNTMDELSEAYLFLADAKKHKYDWVCLDSVSEVAEVCLSEEKKNTKDGRKAYGEMQDRMMNLMRKFRDLPMNVYFSAKQQKVQDEMTGIMIYSPDAPGKNISQAMPYLFDEVFALQTWKDEQGVLNSALQTSRDEQYEAKDRSGALAQLEPADLKHVYDKIMTPTQTTMNLKEK